MCGLREGMRHSAGASRARTEQLCSCSMLMLMLAVKSIAQNFLDDEGKGGFTTNKTQGPRITTDE